MSSLDESRINLLNVLTQRGIRRLARELDSGKYALRVTRRPPDYVLEYIPPTAAEDAAFLAALRLRSWLTGASGRCWDLKVIAAELSAADR